MDWRSAFAFWEWTATPLGAFHLYTALASLVIGALVLRRRKGDIAHRLLGLAYVVAMCATNLSALSIYDFTNGPNYFHLFAALSLLTITAGVVAIVVHGANGSKFALDLHLQMMPWSYLGLCLAAVAEIGTRGLPRLFGDTTQFWQPFFVFLGISGALGGLLTAMLLWPVRKRWLEPQ